MPGPSSVLTVANALSALRLLLTPVFLWLYLRRDGPLAVAVYAIAAASDLLDGLAARALDQRSKLGALLDAVADKFLSLAALLALAARERVPLWLPLLDLSRDLAQLAGAAWLRSRRRVVPIAPTRIGKYATFALNGTVLLALSEEVGAPRSVLAPWVAAGGLVAALCLAVSWIQYFHFFVRSAQGRWAEDPAR
ncbi:MAG TPA: CDP-alcohol phosphatidyltransferase family protein [Anaeromyxobacteraceae bacterium]|jgi:cardiolipin synthase